MIDSFSFFLDTTSFKYELQILHLQSRTRVISFRTRVISNKRNYYAINIRKIVSLNYYLISLFFDNSKMMTKNNDKNKKQKQLVYFQWLPFTNQTVSSHSWKKIMLHSTQRLGTLPSFHLPFWSEFQNWKD